MARKQTSTMVRNKTILLVDDSRKEKHMRALMLNTHGYHVEITGNADDAYRFSRMQRPDLVLLALSNDTNGELNLWERIRFSNPGQRIAFLINDSLYSSPVFSMSDLVRTSEAPEDFLERLGALFCSPS